MAKKGNGKKKERRNAPPQRVNLPEMIETLRNRGFTITPNFDPNAESPGAAPSSARKLRADFPLGATVLRELAESARKLPEAVACVRGGDPDALASALARGADPNEVDANGMNALHHAAALDARPCMRVLVASGKCDYLQRDDFGRYASELAIEWGQDYAVARLLSKKQAQQAAAQGVPAFVPRT